VVKKSSSKERKRKRKHKKDEKERKSRKDKGPVQLSQVRVPHLSVINDSSLRSSGSASWSRMHTCVAESCGPAVPAAWRGERREVQRCLWEEGADILSLCGIITLRRCGICNRLGRLVLLVLALTPEGCGAD